MTMVEPETGTGEPTVPGQDPGRIEDSLLNELMEARADNQLSRALGRWERIELICIDELGYVPLAEVGARSCCSRSLPTGPRRRR